MHIHLTNYHPSEKCIWCEKTKECVTADFGDTFIGTAPLCWSCLQKATKVHTRGESDSDSKANSPPASNAKSSPTSKPNSV